MQKVSSRVVSLQRTDLHTNGNFDIIRSGPCVENYYEQKLDWENKYKRGQHPCNLLPLTNVRTEAAARVQSETLARRRNEALARVRTEMLARVRTEAQARVQNEALARIRTGEVASVQIEVLARIRTGKVASVQIEVLAKVRTKVLTRVRTACNDRQPSCREMECPFEW